MATKVYGASDDLIDFIGDFYGEVGFYGRGDDDTCLLIFSDGTLLTARYGKPGVGGIWQLSLLKQGSLYLGIVPCTDEDAEPHSDVANFADGLKWAYAATRWEKVQ